jgi:hypothetical protein
MTDERHDPSSYLRDETDTTSDRFPEGVERADAQPPDVRDRAGERSDGRPTGETDEDGLRAGTPAADVSTVPAEERGHQPTTEHSPGGDL